MMVDPVHESDMKMYTRDQTINKFPVTNVKASKCTSLKVSVKKPEGESPKLPAFVFNSRSVAPPSDMGYRSRSVKRWYEREMPKQLQMRSSPNSSVLPRKVLGKSYSEPEKYPDEDKTRETAKQLSADYHVSRHTMIIAIAAAMIVVYYVYYR
jgi:hypothetical protein